MRRQILQIFSDAPFLPLTQRHLAQLIHGTIHSHHWDGRRSVLNIKPGRYWSGKQRRMINIWIFNAVSLRARWNRLLEKEELLSQHTPWDWSMNDAVHPHYMRNL